VTSRLLRDALTPGSSDATIRAYLAEAPDVELVLDDEARAGLAQHASDTIKVAILTLAGEYEGLRGGEDVVDPRPLGPTREEQDAAWWAEVEKWGNQ
jgi:hypothetical protein